MRATIAPGRFEGGRASVPGDKSIAHRWLILAATARGRCEVRGVPAALDVRATAGCLAALAPDEARPPLEALAAEPAREPDRDRSTSNAARPRGRDLLVEGKGRWSLHPPRAPLDCANSGTTMRMLAGVLASAPFEAVLEGDPSLSRRPMERVAEPLRAMGADVRTTDGHAPVVVRGGALRGTVHRTPVPSAQVKSAVILAGLAASGETTVVEPAPTRDHTERALAALGAPVEVGEGRVSVRAFDHAGFAAGVPGDLSSAAFLVAAALLTGRALVLEDVGLNPTRTRFLDVVSRMGARIRTEVAREELGEPVGTLEVDGSVGLSGVEVEPGELPSLIDEVPVLALVAAHARGQSRFGGAAELRVKESDRLSGIAGAIRALGGEAAVEGDDLVVGGGGLRGGLADARGDHRMAMSIAVGALAAAGPTTIEGIEAAEVSFPGFLRALAALGASIEVGG